MNTLLVVEMGVEGGGATIYGRQEDGIWSFWQEGSSMGLDEYDDEEWRSWESKPVADLSLALPDEWPLFCPIKIAPEFLEWFRENYEIVCSRLRKDLNTVASSGPGSAATTRCDGVRSNDGVGGSQKKSGSSSVMQAPPSRPHAIRTGPAGGPPRESPAGLPCHDAADRRGRPGRAPARYGPPPMTRQAAIP